MISAWCDHIIGRRRVPSSLEREAEKGIRVPHMYCRCLARAGRGRLLVSASATFCGPAHLNNLTWPAAAKGTQLHVAHVPRLLSKSRPATVNRAWKRWSEHAGESETSQRLSVAMFHRLAHRRALCLGRICGVAFSLLCTATARVAALRDTLQRLLRTRMSQLQRHSLSRWHAATCAVRKLRRALCKMQGSGTLIIGTSVSAARGPAVEHAHYASAAPTSACFRAMSLRGSADGCAGARRSIDGSEGLRSLAHQRARGGRARYSPRARRA